VLPDSENWRVAFDVAFLDDFWIIRYVLIAWFVSSSTVKACMLPVFFNVKFLKV
jgi:hypothetical protein